LISSSAGERVEYDRERAAVLIKPVSNASHRQRNGEFETRVVRAFDRTSLTSTSTAHHQSTMR
jgi:hypothetical protein